MKEIGGKGTKASEALVSTSLGILEEMKLIQRETIGNKREITMIANPPQVSLKASLRFNEGHEELIEFIRFKEEILTMKEPDLLDFVQRPICPNAGIISTIPQEKYAVNWL